MASGQNDKTGVAVAMPGKEKATENKSPHAFAKGQIWKTKDAYIEILEVGKTLLDYRLLKRLGQMRKTQTTNFKTMNDYLKQKRARLVKGNSSN